MINGHLVFIIAACDNRGGLGKNNALPWRLRKEMNFFTRTTVDTKDPAKENLVIMGQKTWESIPKKFRPLPSRKNIVLSLDPEYATEGAEVFNTIQDALNANNESIENIFIIGGASIYKQTIQLPEVDGIYLTHIEKDYKCDVFFPKIPKTFKIKQKIGSESENGTHFVFTLYRKNIQ